MTGISDLLRRTFRTNQILERLERIERSSHSDQILERLERIEQQMHKQTDEFEARFHSLQQQVHEYPHAIQLLQEVNGKTELRSLSDEITLCRDISDSTVFVLGFARSSTTITAEILNSCPDVLLLSEANFYLPCHESRFRDWYNRMHVEFNNQISKITYAPDFVPEVNHDWLDWLCGAKKMYPIVGDKMAFSSKHFDLAGPSTIRYFIESRFYKARYIYTIHNPRQSLLSAAKLFGILNDDEIIREIIAWLRFIQLWADWVRVFPNTFTFIADDLCTDTVGCLQEFLGIDLHMAETFIDKRHITNHCNTNAFPILAKTENDLVEIFDMVKAAIEMKPCQWQRNTQSIGRNNDSVCKFDRAHLPKAPIFSAWAMCQNLIGKLEQANPIQLTSTN